MNDAALQKVLSDPRVREAASTLPVYGQLPFVPMRAAGCDIITTEGNRILDLYGGHAVAALGYGHPRLLAAIQEQAQRLLFQSNAVALEVRAEAAEQLTAIAPENLTRAFFVNSGAEANENALRIACLATGRKKILAITHGFTVAQPLPRQSHGAPPKAGMASRSCRSRSTSFHATMSRPYTTWSMPLLPP